LNLQPSSGESEKIIRKRHVAYSVPNSNLLLSSVPHGKIKKFVGQMYAIITIQRIPTSVNIPSFKNATIAPIVTRA